VQGPASHVVPGTSALHGTVLAWVRWWLHTPSAAKQHGTVFVRIWQYEVAEGREQDFERIYAADGDWATLFAVSNGYVGTELYRCIGSSRRYITIDRFSSAEAWHRLLDKHGARYAGIDRLAEATTSTERELIAFDQL
jgi:heme-degrading monooxygenase HmoA